jgi:hypothetical protein
MGIEDLALHFWPSRSPDLTSCDFLLWGFVKQAVSQLRWTQWRKTSFYGYGMNSATVLILSLRPEGGVSWQDWKFFQREAARKLSWRIWPFDRQRLGKHRLKAGIAAEAEVYLLGNGSLVFAAKDSRPKHELFGVVASIRSSRICKRVHSWIQEIHL